MKKMFSVVILFGSLQANATDYFKKFDVYSGMASSCKKANELLDEKVRKFVEVTKYEILSVEVLKCKESELMRNSFTQEAVLSVKLDGILGNPQ